MKKSFIVIMVLWLITTSINIIGCAARPAQVVQVQNSDGTISTVATSESVIKSRYLGRLKSGSSVDVYADDTNGNICYTYSSYGISCVPNTKANPDYKNVE